MHMESAPHHTVLHLLGWWGNSQIEEEAEEWGLAVLHAVVAHGWRGAHLKQLRL